MEVNIIFRINTNSSSADRKEGTNLLTIPDFTKKIIFDFRNSQLASYLVIQGGPIEHREGKHSSGSEENEQSRCKKTKGK